MQSSPPGPPRLYIKSPSYVFFIFFNFFRRRGHRRNSSALRQRGANLIAILLLLQNQIPALLHGFAKSYTKGARGCVAEGFAKGHGKGFDQIIVE
jgi:hypothetical protein